MSRVTARVTQEHIDCGTPNDPFACIITLEFELEMKS